MIRPGQFASSDPRCVFLSGRVPFLPAGDDGVEVGVFAWVDPDTGKVENTRYSNDYSIGFVLPTADYEALPLYSNTVPPNCQVSLAVKGEFFGRFRHGSKVGDRVYASVLDGSLISGEAPLAQATSWYVISDVPPGGLAIISTWRHT
jgi:hypothetical protein